MRYDNSGYLNDWLKQEFRERVNRQRNVELYPLLSRALKEFRVEVSIEEEKEEETIIKNPPLISTSACSQKESEIAGIFRTAGLGDLANDLG